MSPASIPKACPAAAAASAFITLCVPFKGKTTSAEPVGVFNLNRVLPKPSKTRSDAEISAFSLIPYVTTEPLDNGAIAAIRKAGASNLILVPGNGWTGASSWTQNWYGTTNATAMLNIKDPGNNFAFEAHQYLDADGGLARYRGEDAHRLGAHAEGDVLVQTRDLLDAHAGGSEEELGKAIAGMGSTLKKACEAGEGAACTVAALSFVAAANPELYVEGAQIAGYVALMEKGCRGGEDDQCRDRAHRIDQPATTPLCPAA